MGRGRGTRGSFSAFGSRRAAISRTPSPTPAEQAEEIFDDCLGTQTRELLETYAAFLAEGIIPDALKGLLSGRPAHTIPHANCATLGFAAEALYESGADWEVVREAYERALSHQITHVAAIEEAIRRPRTRAAQALFALHGLVGDPALQTRRLGYLQDQQEIVTRLSTCIATRAPADARTSEFALREAVNVRTLHLLLGGRRSTARELLLRYADHAGVSNLSGTLSGGGEEVMEQAVVVARAEEMRGESERIDWTMMLRRPETVEARYAQLASPSLAGDAVERMLVAHGLETLRSTPVCETAGDALAQAHALLRNPLLGGRQIAASRADTDDLKITVAVEADALEELVARYREDPAWQGMRAVLEPPAGLGGATRPELPEIEGRTSRAWLGARLRARIGERMVDIDFQHPIAPTMIRKDERVIDFVSTEWAKRSQMTIGGDIEFGNWNGEVVKSRSTKLPRATAPRSAESLLGPDACSHQGASWEPILDRFAPEDGVKSTSLRLSCPRCLRRRVAVAPAHRLMDDPPPLVASLLRNEKKYLTTHRIQRVIAGDTAERGSVAALRAADGPMSSNPSDYAITPRRGGMGGPGTPASVRDAMNRR